MKGLHYCLVQGCLPYAASKQEGISITKTFSARMKFFYITTVNTCIKSLNVTVFDIIFCLECCIYF